MVDTETEALWADQDKLSEKLGRITKRRMDECQFAAQAFDMALHYYDPSASQARLARLIPGHETVRYGPPLQGDPIKEQRRQMMRLTRENPRQDALSALSPQAKFHLERALLNRGERTEDWQSRPLKELRPAAVQALAALGAPAGRLPRGRPKDYFGRRYVATCAHIAEEVLSVRPSYGSLCAG